ncbi:MAG: alanine racemase [Planctomycetota bacterium]|jgi:alanine racemase
MKLTRRSLIGGSVLGSVAAKALPLTDSRSNQARAEKRFDPWVDVDASALTFNLGQLRKLADGRPVLAVVKNNAYGLGLLPTALLLEKEPGVLGFAVVKVDAALALRSGGIKKPVLHMGTSSLEEAREMVEQGIQLSLYREDAAERVGQLSERAGRAIPAHLYLDTGLGRLGMPYHKASEWIATLAGRNDLDIKGCFMGFTEEPDFDREQLRRFLDLASEMKTGGVDLGPLHAASSNGIYHLPEARLDMVRPGISLYGAYPTRPKEEQAKAELRPALNLRCRVVRVAQLRAGDSAGYGRNYVARQPTWIATLPAGHTDGVPRDFVKGGRVLIGEQTYPIIGAVSASHCMVELGQSPSAAVGDVATILGSGHPAIQPSQQSIATGVSVYDLLMHLNPALPRFYRS